MNRNFSAVILIVLAVGIYFTFTSGKLEELKAVQVVNDQYQEAIKKSEDLIKERDKVNALYSSISIEDRDRLNKLLPNTVDNIRLIIDVKDNIAAKHRLVLRNIKTESPEATQALSSTVNRGGEVKKEPGFGTVSLSFLVSTDYNTFMAFLKDVEASLRIMDISKLTVTPNQTGSFDFSVEIKTYWLKE